MWLMPKPLGAVWENTARFLLLDSPLAEVIIVLPRQSIGLLTDLLCLSGLRVLLFQS